MKDTDTLRELVARATPGPWYTLGPPWLTDGNTSILAESPDPHVARFICDFDFFAFDEEDDKTSLNPDADAALIVAAVNALPTLLDRLDAERARAIAAETRLAEAEGVIGMYLDWGNLSPKALAEKYPDWPRDVHVDWVDRRARQFLNPEQS